MMSLREGERTAPEVLITSCEAQRSLMHDLNLIRRNFIRAGRDAARAFGTGCFATHQTHDLRGLDEQEMKVYALSLLPCLRSSCSHVLL